MFIILSGSSGVGKNTVINRILEQMDCVKLMPTITTREMRANEKPGNPYIFVTSEVFEKMIKNNELIEYKEVHGFFYGTSKLIVEEKLKEGYILIKDIDVDGTQILVRDLKDVITIYLKPKSKDQLIERLKGRGESRVDDRLRRYDCEEKMAEKYKYILINDDIDETINNIKSIIEFERKNH